MGDRVLNLSAFGDILKNPKSEKPSALPPYSSQKTGQSSEGSDKYGIIYKMVLQNMIQTKLLHWQCAFYGQHKALNKLFDSIVDLGDTLAESLMGKYGKPVLSEDNLSIKLYNFENPEDGDLSSFMEHLYKCYMEDCRSLLEPGTDSELINILDEIVAAVDQTKYLISLR
jgi:DNA-binding ferritin-like protein